MKQLTTKLMQIFALLSICSPLVAQKIDVAELWERGEVSLHGFHPKSLEVLVGTSKIIVKGKFLRFLESELFYGFDHTRESYGKAHGIPEEDLDKWGVPISDYEIVVEEVLLGDRYLVGRSIVFRQAESTLLVNNFINNKEDDLNEQITWRFTN